MKCLPLVVLAALLCCACGTQTQTPTPTQALAPPQPPPPPPPAPQVLQTWTSNFAAADGSLRALTFVGTDPSHAGAGTTNISVVIIPVTFLFNGQRISPTDAACGDTVPIVTRVQNSPLFDSSLTWTDGPTNVGTTQYVDAFQRANFWNTVSTVSPNYHVLLNVASVLPAVTFDVSLFGTLAGSNPGCPLRPPLQVSFNDMNTEVQSLISQLQIPPNQLPIFLTYNVVFALQGGGFYFGYHSALGNHSFVVASYADAGLGNSPAADISILSHEFGEWMNDPFGTNQVPAWNNPEDQSCSGVLEVGDPLLPNVFTVNSGGFQYHLQELAFASWFLGGPSFGVNGWYSNQGGFLTPAAVCF